MPNVIVTFTATPPEKPTSVNIIVNPPRARVPNGPGQNVTWLLAGTPDAKFALTNPISFYASPPWPYGAPTRDSDTQVSVNYTNSDPVLTVYGYNAAVTYLGTTYNIDPEVGNDPPGGGSGGSGGGDQGDNSQGKPPGSSGQPGR
jgi:hypothetical protein